uniref:DnaJ heat shock protein family (Hsp40) member C28 n=1 Tax=Oncorhynchus kisutch TaxID=8019 RepID=A0A8C7JW98_ONCKI
MLLPLAPRFLLRKLSSGPCVSCSLRESYQLLQLELLDEGESSPAQVKEAYLRMATLYHPLLRQTRYCLRGSAGAPVPEKVKDVAPQHCHDLSYEGVGSGMPSQREHQYRQFQVDWAVEQVLDYLQKDRQIKVTQAVERLVEDLIQESMSRGDFRNLSDAGKPLNKFEHNQYDDLITLNHILIDNGYQPPWIVMQHDIREDIAPIRDRLLCWITSTGFAPMLTMQMTHFSLEHEIDHAEKAAIQGRQERKRESERVKKY